jgi:rhodanese-related sulfurtransferase
VTKVTVGGSKGVHLCSKSEKVMEKTETGTYKNLAPSEFQTELSRYSNGILLDVRTVPEFNGARIPKAVNIDVMSSTFYDEIAGLDKTKTYFVYCRSGGRSMQACSIMAELGFKAFNLAGGISNWPGEIVTT